MTKGESGRGRRHGGGGTRGKKRDHAQQQQHHRRRECHMPQQQQQLPVKALGRGGDVYINVCRAQWDTSLKVEEGIGRRRRRVRRAWLIPRL